MKKHRGSQLIRQWNLLRACECEEGLSVEELRDLLKASRRTIYRDILILRESGAKIICRKASGQIKYRSIQPYFAAAISQSQTSVEIGTTTALFAKPLGQD